MPGASNRIKVYKDLVEFVLGLHKDLVSLERLNLFLGKSKLKEWAVNSRRPWPGN